MLTDAFIETPAQYLANAFAEHVVAWAQDLGASRECLGLLRHVAWLTSMSASDGHVCLLLVDIASSYRDASVADLRHLLLSSSVVGTCAAPSNLPLIVDEQGRVYLHRYFDYEKRLAHRLIAACDAADSAQDGSMLAKLFGPLPDSGEADWQRIAAALALRRRLTVISGGPGTGKTTTVANLLACLLQENPIARIALAAPTGKAAARMMEAIRSRASNMPTHLQALLPNEAFTIHRLLDVLPDSGGFRHHAGNLLPIDVLVVDEASMLDVALAACLLDAVPDHARIVLLGDKDQLAAVEAGAVFSELCTGPSLTHACIDDLAAMTEISADTIRCPASVRPSALEDSVIWLSKSYRFAPDSGIGRFATDIKTGASVQAVDWLRMGNNANVRWLEDSASKLDSRTQQCMHDGYADYLAAMRNGSHDRTAVFSAFERFRVLCAVQEGSRGVAEINQAISRNFRRTLNHEFDRDYRSDWYPGRPIMVRKNDYVLKLYNGDIGIALPDESGRLMAWFEDDQTGFRAIPLARLPVHETAFAMTVHKSQGSEFDSVMLLLPSRPGRILTRELIYTGITRARKTVMLACSEDVLKSAIGTTTQRRSGLISRLMEAKAPMKENALLPAQLRT